MMPRLTQKLLVGPRLLGITGWTNGNTGLMDAYPPCGQPREVIQSSFGWQPDRTSCYVTEAGAVRLASGDAVSFPGRCSIGRTMTATTRNVRGRSLSAGRYRRQTHAEDP